MARPGPQAAAHEGAGLAPRDEGVQLQIGDGFDGDGAERHRQGQRVEPAQGRAAVADQRVDRQAAEEHLQRRKQVDAEQVGQQRPAPNYIQHYFRALVNHMGQCIQQHAHALLFNQTADKQ